jgi:exopolysaccharide biosynthesis polyprenyl glycosylphosphotransferase
MTTADSVLGHALGREYESYGIIGAERAYSRFSRWWLVFQAVSDYAAILLAMSAAWWLGRALWGGLGAHLRPGSMVLGANLVALFALLIFRHFGLYDAASTAVNIRELESLLRSVVLAFCAVLVTLFIYAPAIFPLPLVLLAGALVLGALLVERNACFALVRWVHAKGYGVRRVLICGAKDGRAVFRRIQGNPRLGLCCVGFVDEDTAESRMAANEVKSEILGDWAELKAVAGRERVDDIIVADPRMVRDKFVAIMRQCRELNVCVSFVPDLFGPYHQWFSFELFDGLPLARCRQAAITAAGNVGKRLFDLVIAGLLVLFLAPVFLLVGLLVRLDSPGRSLFCHERVGKDGRRFRMFKFRSMRTGSPQYQRSPSSNSDPRLTRFGRFLRRTSLDELPQLFNVLRGEMSLVGPRPEMPYVVDGYGPIERDRLRVKPGITGLWQVSPARAMPIHENIEYDLFYIEHQNVFLDCAILLATIVSVVRGVGAF